MTPARVALLHEAVDRQAAEQFEVLPTAAAGGGGGGGQWLDVNGRMIADPVRGSQTFSGIWAEPGVRSEVAPELAGRSRAGGAGREISAGRPTVKYDAAALPWRPGVGWQVKRLATGERFSIAEIDGDGFGRTVLILTARG